VRPSIVFPASGAAHRDALRLLEKEGERRSRVIEVTPDSILFVTHEGTARTAWVRRLPNTGAVHVVVEDGFVACPPNVEDE
jgi:hypothetical protein